MKQKDYLPIIFGIVICFIFAILIILVVILAITTTSSQDSTTTVDFKSNGNQIQPELPKNNNTGTIEVDRTTNVTPKIDSRKSLEYTEITPLSEGSWESEKSHRIKKCRTFKKYHRKRSHPIKSSSDFSSYTDDSEINSVGDSCDLPFDIHSPISECSVSIPYSEKSGKVYCKKEIISTGSNCVIVDVCSYSDMTIFLMDNGKFIVEREHSRTKIQSNVVLTKISSFQGYLYGISEAGELYRLQDAEDKIWIWSKIKWCSENIIDINSTFDGSKLWIQTEEKAYLYSDENVSEKIEFSKHKRRVYGKNHRHYVDIDMKTLSAKTSDGRKYDNVSYAALDYYDEVVTIPLDEKHKFKSIVIVDWKPFYLASL